MGNLFCSEYTIHRRFDLKGSSHGRTTAKPESEIDPTTTLKDLDLNYIFRLHKVWFQDFCRWFTSSNILSAFPSTFYISTLVFVLCWGCYGERFITCLQYNLVYQLVKEILEHDYPCCSSNMQASSRAGKWTKIVTSLNKRELWITVFWLVFTFEKLRIRIPWHQLVVLELGLLLAFALQLDFLHPLAQELLLVISSHLIRSSFLFSELAQLNWWNGSLFFHQEMETQIVNLEHSHAFLEQRWIRLFLTLLGKLKLQNQTSFFLTLLWLIQNWLLSNPTLSCVNL